MNTSDDLKGPPPGKRRKRKISGIAAPEPGPSDSEYLEPVLSTQAAESYDEESTNDEKLTPDQIRRRQHSKERRE